MIYITYNNVDIPCLSGPPLQQVRIQSRTESSRGYDSHSSSTLSSEAPGASRPLPPPVALKPSYGPRAEEPGREEEDPASRSFLGKVSTSLCTSALFSVVDVLLDVLFIYILGV